MKSFSLVAISGLFASTLAAPAALLGGLGNSNPVIPVATNLVSGVAAPATGVVANAPVAGPLVGTGVGVVGGVDSTVSEVAPLKRAADATQVITVLQQLHTTVIQHTTVINSTVVKFTKSSSFSSSSSSITKTTSSQTTQVSSGVNVSVNTLIVNEITAISIAISGAINTITTFKGASITATTVEVTQIAGLLFQIVSEISFTVFNAIQVLGIQVLLNGLLISLTSVIATLLQLVESVVAGVLVVVGGLINVQGVIGIVDGVLAGLVGAILSGNLTALVAIHI